MPRCAHKPSTTTPRPPRRSSRAAQTKRSSCRSRPRQRGCPSVCPRPPGRMWPCRCTMAPTASALHVPALLAPRERKVTAGSPGSGASRGCLGREGGRAARGRRVTRGLGAPPDHQDLRGHQDHRVLGEPGVHPHLQHSPRNQRESWEQPAPPGSQDPPVPQGCLAPLAPLAPQVTQAMKALQGSLGGRGSLGPPAHQGPWDHLGSQGAKELRDPQAWLGLMAPRGHRDSQAHRDPPGHPGMKGPPAPQDLCHSLANQGSEGSRDSQDQRVRRVSKGCRACRGALAAPGRWEPQGCPVLWDHQGHRGTTGVKCAMLGTMERPAHQVPRVKRAIQESGGAAMGSRAANRATSRSPALAVSPAPGTNSTARRSRISTEQSFPTVPEVPPAPLVPLVPPEHQDSSTSIGCTPREDSSPASSRQRPAQAGQWLLQMLMFTTRSRWSPALTSGARRGCSGRRS